MDHNFTDVFEGTRQYFQGLPKASPGKDGCQGEQMAVAQSTWPVPVSGAPTRSERNSMSTPGSRPPSANVAAPAAAPPSEVPERPPSEALIEPEPHIIHKATVMQQAQQKQQSYIVSRDLERPPSVNMISPPTHIIHKPPRFTQEQPPVEENRQTPKEEPRIPPHFAVTEVNYPSQSMNKPPSMPVQNKYSSHLPTPPQPSIHNSSHFHSRIPGSTQQRNLTILQSRQAPRPVSYPSRSYPPDMMHSNNNNVVQKNTMSSSTSSSSFPQPTYDMSSATSSTMDGRRSSSISETYLQSTHTSKVTTISPHSSQKSHIDVQHYSRNVGYNYPQNPMIHRAEQDKSSSNGMGLKGYAQSIQQQKSRALPVSKSSGIHQNTMQSRQYTYSQKIATQQTQAGLYHQTPNSHYSAISNSHPMPQENTAHLKHPPMHNYDYTNRLSHHKVPSSDMAVAPGPAYQERITPLPPEQRHASSVSHPVHNIHSTRGTLHPSMPPEPLHYSRVQAVASHHSTKSTSSDYHTQPIKSHQTPNQMYSNNANHYPMMNSRMDHSALNSTNTSVAGSYQMQSSYQSATAVVKHSYDTPKTTPSARPLATKQNMSLHQPRMTVSVTSLVNQMNARQQSGSRQDNAGALVTKQKKESPLDLSVKTVRIPADSTAQDDTENINYDKREVNTHHSNNLNNIRDMSGMPPNMLNPSQRLQHKPNNISSSHKVDFLPNFNTNSTEKVSAYRESNQAYVQNNNINHYDQMQIKNNCNIPHQYPSKTTHGDVQYNNRHDINNKHLYGSQSYSRRVESSLPKIDLTTDHDHVNNRRVAMPVHLKEDSRKRESNYVPISTSVPPKMARYEAWNYERHSRPDAMQGHPGALVPNHYKVPNGVNIPPMNQSKVYNNDLYKKSENIEPFKYHMPHYQHPTTQTNEYYQMQSKSATYQNYDYNNYVDKNMSSLKQDSNTANSAIYNNHYVTPPANKKVLSLLRNSLEAKNSAENQKTVDNSNDDCIIIPSDDNSVHSNDFVEIRTKKSRNLEYQNNLKSNVITENQSYKVHVPRAVDSIKYELDSSQKLLKMRDELKNSIEQIKNDLLDASLCSSDLSQSSEIDAARIRTKAELKGFIQSNVKNNNANTDTVITKTSEAESSKAEHHRRRLFSKSDAQNDKNPTENHKNNVSVIRSSSDSVFDFQDSGSECELSKGDKQLQNKSSLNSVIGPIANIKVEKDVDDDPFWSETCDNLLEQLRSGKAKRVRKKKTISSVEKANLDIVKIEETSIVNVLSVIKTEAVDEPVVENGKVESKKSEQPPSSDSSDEDQPLKLLKEISSERKEKRSSKVDGKSDYQTPLKKKVKSKSINSELNSKLKSRTISSDDEQLSLKKIKKENAKDDLLDYNASESESDHVSNVNKKKLRKSSSFSKCMDGKSNKNADKDSLKMKEEFMKGKKPGFGDGSDFRPGWEEEVYKYKRSLRMPASLINVSGFAQWPRVSSSLPDLDPCPNSPALSSSTEELFTQRLNDKSNNKDIDSDGESSSSVYNHRKSNYDSEASCSTIMSTASKKLKSDTSFLDVLIQKYGKKDTKKSKIKYENNCPKIIPKAENPIELLATPGLELDKTTSKGISNSSKEKVMRDLFYVGSFRQETVSTFRNTFINNTDGLLGATQEFAPMVLKSRTRTETRVMKKRATIKEVFGDERSASAPPLPYREEEPEHIEDTTKSAEIKDKIQIKKSKKEINIGMIREGLRSSRLLRKNDPKGRLLRMRKRNNLLKILSSKKVKTALSPTVKIKKEDVPPIAKDDIEIKTTTTVKIEEPPTCIPIKKACRRLFQRRKLSSGFDYIRKKKKLMKKSDNVKKRSALPRPSPESVHDIQREIKGWIINKSVGESVLHKAARLGYTDCVAYCLEKMDLPPSIRDNAGYTALHEACSRGHLDIARLLLQYGANVSEAAKGGIRPLHEACENGYIEIIRLLLSYGADPLLATYSGQTPISLSGGKAARLIQLHLNDVQGNIPQVWQFNGPCKLLDPIESGYDPLTSPPPAPPSSPPPSPLEFVTATSALPPLYRLKPSNHSNPVSDNSTTPQDTGLWCLLQDLSALLQVKSRDALLKQIHCGPGPPRESLKELRMQEFLDRAQCQQLMSAGEKINIRASKIALVRYTEKVKQLLNIETVLVR